MANERFMILYDMPVPLFSCGCFSLRCCLGCSRNRVSVRENAGWKARRLSLIQDYPE